MTRSSLQVPAFRVWPSRRAFTQIARAAADEARWHAFRNQASMKQLGTFGWIGAILAAVMGVIELVRAMATTHDLRGWGGAVSDVGAATFVILLAITAVGLAMRRRFGWAFGIFASLAALGYSVIITAGGPGHGHERWGGLYLIGGMALLLCLARSLASYRVPAART